MGKERKTRAAEDGFGDRKSGQGQQRQQGQGQQGALAHVVQIMRAGGRAREEKEKKEQELQDLKDKEEAIKYQKREPTVSFSIVMTTYCSGICKNGNPCKQTKEKRVELVSWQEENYTALKGDFKMKETDTYFCKTHRGTFRDKYVQRHGDRKWKVEMAGGLGLVPDD